ncbi:MAG: hypothetical protein IT306_08285 [Chloroflexi bacterium]|nr:hypothetical protein [Chloroflexota bacterium]
MEALQALPGWAQFLIGLLAAAVLVVLNVGWLMQARGWMMGQQQKIAAQREAARKRADAIAPSAPGRSATPGH